MAKLGIRKFQDLIGRTDFLHPREGHHLKADLMDLEGVLKNALELRSNVDIRGGSVAQNFRLDNRCAVKKS
jgi:glutamate synthase (NADPH/NADH)